MNFVSQLYLGTRSSLLAPATDRPSKSIRSRFALAAILLATMGFAQRSAAQSGTLTDDGFVSTRNATQHMNQNGLGPSLIVAGASATSSTTGPVGTTTTFLKFQLQSSLPPSVAAANVAKATLKLFISPNTTPTGAVDLYSVNSAWTETTLNPSSPPSLEATSFATDIVVGGANSFLVADVTQLVKDWLNGPANGGITNDGIALAAHTSATFVVFDSKENTVTSHEPRVEIVLVDAGPQGPAGLPGPQGPAGLQGPAGAAATVNVGTTTTGLAGTSAMVTNAGTSSAALLDFVIPRGPTGAVGSTGATGPAGPTGPQGPQGPPGIPGPIGLQGPAGPAGLTNRGPWNSTVSYNANDAVFDSASYWLAMASNTGSEPSPSNANWQLLAGGFVNRGPWNTSNSYNVNDAVSDNGSFWLALAAIPANRPTSEPSGSNTNWQLLAAQGGTGPAGTSGPVGPQGPQGIPGPMGLQGPPGPMPTGAALTTTTNTFSGNQSINGNLILNGTGAGIQFADGTTQMSAASGGGQPPSGSLLVSASSAVPAGYSFLTLQKVADFWLPVASMPTARRALAAVTLNGKIYAVGGDLGSSATVIGTLEIYDPVANTWTTGAPMPTARSYLAAAVANGKIYAVGGLSASNTSLSTVEVYDPATNAWSTLTSMPTARLALAAAGVNGRIYAFGGIANWPTNLAPTTILEVYNPTTNSWTSSTTPVCKGCVPGPAPMPGVAGSGISYLAAAVANGKIYAVGGDDGGTATNPLQVYDPAANAWSSLTSMPTPRRELAASVANGKIYAIGGNAGSGPTLTCLSTVEAYDPGANTWTEAAGLSSPTSDLAASDANGAVYTLGGVFFSGGSSQLFNSVQRYVPAATLYTYVKN